MDRFERILYDIITCLLCGFALCMAYLCVRLVQMILQLTA